MDPLIITCDRCRRTFEAYRNRTVTAGYYDTSEGYWAQFADPEEKKICDQCMWSDERYIAVYGRVK